MTARRAAAALALLAAAGPAAGYVRSTSDEGAPLAWPVPVVAYHESSAAAFLAPSCGSPGDLGPALAAVRASFDAWRVSCSELDLVDAGLLGEIRTGLGGTSENLVVFRRGWCSLNPDAVANGCMGDPDVDCGGIYDCFEDHGDTDRHTLALTSVLYYPDTGRIVDADIEVNAWDGEPGVLTDPPQHGWYFTCDAQPGWRRCAAYGEEGCYYADLQNTLTHEAGHFIGLRHPCNGTPPSGPDADLPACGDAHAATTMYPLTAPGDLDKRTLDADDVAGVCAIYPSSGGGGCGCGAGGAPGAIAALLAAAALRPRRRRPSGAARRGDQATRTPA